MKEETILKKKKDPAEWFEEVFQIEEKLRYLYSILDNPVVNEAKVLKEIGDLKRRLGKLIKEGR